MRDAAPLVVRHRPAELLLRHLLVRHGPHDVGAGHEHVARALHHDDEVGDRRRVHGAARTRPHDRGDLRDDTGGERVPKEDVGVAGEREHAFLNPRAAGVIEPDDRRTHLHRQIHDLDDLGGVGLRQRAAEDGEVLRERVGETAVDASVPGDDSVTGHDLLPHAEVAAPVGDEGVDLFERVGVEEEQRALTRGQFARIALALQPLFPTAQRGAALKVV